jgi:ribose-phosphate pyrophosphokinase
LPEITIIAGPSSPDLAARVARHLQAPLVPAELRVFSDGESKIKIAAAAKAAGNCVIIQSAHPPTDTHLMQAMMMARRCADAGARDICAVIPYLAYARQDRAFLEGEVASVAVVAKMLEAAGVTHVITVDVHSQLAMSHFTSIENVSSIPLLADYAAKMKLHRPIAVSPDAGGADRAREFARHVRTDMVALKKSRDRNTGDVTIDEKLDANVEGRDAILIDDMISSGGSIIKAAEVLYKNGAGKVYAMCAHALLIGNAADRIKAAGVQDIIATNSVPGEYAKVDLSPAIAAAIKSRYAS